MADDTAFQVLARIELDLATLKKQLGQAEGEVGKSTGRIKGSFDKFSTQHMRAVTIAFQRMLPGIGGATSGIFQMARAFGPAGAAIGVAALALSEYTKAAKIAETSQRELAEAVGDTEKSAALVKKTTAALNEQNATLIQAGKQWNSLGDALIGIPSLYRAMMDELTGVAKMQEEAAKNAKANLATQIQVFEKPKQELEFRRKIHEIETNELKTWAATRTTVKEVEIAYSRMREELLTSRGHLDEIFKSEKQILDMKLQSGDIIKEQYDLSLQDAKNRRALGADAIETQRKQTLKDQEKQMEGIREKADKMQDSVAGEKAQRMALDYSIRLAEVGQNIEARYELERRQIEETDALSEETFQREKARIEALIEKDKTNQDLKDRLASLEEQRTTARMKRDTDLKLKQMAFEKSQAKPAAAAGTGSTFAPVGSSIFAQAGEARGFITSSAPFERYGVTPLGLPNLPGAGSVKLGGSEDIAKGAERILGAAQKFEEAAASMKSTSVKTSGLDSADASSYIGRLGQLEARRGPSPQLTE